MKKETDDVKTENILILKSFKNLNFTSSNEIARE